MTSRPRDISVCVSVYAIADENRLISRARVNRVTLGDNKLILLDQPKGKDPSGDPNIANFHNDWRKLRIFKITPSGTIYSLVTVLTFPPAILLPNYVFYVHG